MVVDEVKCEIRMRGVGNTFKVSLRTSERRDKNMQIASGINFASHPLHCRKRRRLGTPSQIHRIAYMQSQANRQIATSYIAETFWPQTKSMKHLGWTCTM